MAKSLHTAAARLFRSVPEFALVTSAAVREQIETKPLPDAAAPALPEYAGWSREHRVSRCSPRGLRGLRRVWWLIFESRRVCDHLMQVRVQDEGPWILALSGSTRSALHALCHNKANRVP
jgi:hypothetical protein